MTMETGIPAVLPGVYITNSADSLRRLIRSPSCPHAARPSRQSCAWAAAYSSGERFFLLASSSFIQGRKSSGLSSGNVKRRFPMSPFGSMTIDGMPSIAASSSRAMHNPVLPLPVMPTQTPCVTRSFES